jgi:hypothetical protein
MRRLFVLGLLVGLAGVLAAAHFLPWVSHTRLTSQTSVIANGGRSEQFMIRLPADRIATVALDGPASPASSFAAALEGQAPALEHYKLRDRTGNVVGIAARHWALSEDGATTTWALVFPARGAIVLAHAGEARDAIEAALRNRGHVVGSPWDGEVRVALVDDAATTRSIVGLEEFEGLDVRYTEAWSLTGVDENGEVRGTIELDTVSRRGT